MNEQDDMLKALRSLGIVPEGRDPVMVLLTGGVSCRVYRIDLASGPICAKVAMPRLSVKADWRAPVERVHNEAQWFRFANGVVPGCAPQVLAEDRSAHLIVTSYFEPSVYPCWKDRLRDGAVDASFAAKVGALLSALHAASAGSEEIESAFAYDDFFLALRIEPYLLHTAKAHPDLAPRIEAIAAGISRARIALMHGDFSPKNILVGPEGPVVLDAETACYGDPAFDLAFCLNHLLLKCVWRPAHVVGYVTSFRALRDSYLAGVSWEDSLAIERRTAAILPALLLARIDGKSPVEYLTSDSNRDFVRQAARDYLAREPLLEDLLRDWEVRTTRRVP